MPDCGPDFTAQTGQHGCMDGQDMTADLEMTTVEPRHWSSSAADVLLADGMIALIRPRSKATNATVAWLDSSNRRVT